jgi:nucleotide-binding universal stress UspA family protein
MQEHSPSALPVLVGIDGSPPSVAAAEFAAAFAQRREAPLRLVHAYQRPLYGYDIAGLPLEASDEQLRAVLEGTLADLAERLRVQFPGLPSVDTRQVYRTPAGLLIEESGSALVTVVGCRGVGGFAELMLGSVSSQVAAHARGPVVVVRGQHPHRTGEQRPVLVGFDGSSAASRALDFAAVEAVARKAPLVVAHVYTGSDEEAKQLLTDAVEPWAWDYTGQPIELRPIYSPNPDYALIEASRSADLIVVGSRGRGGFLGLALGSVSRTLVHHAYSPVAVIHSGHH